MRQSNCPWQRNNQNPMPERKKAYGGSAQMLAYRRLRVSRFSRVIASLLSGRKWADAIFLAAESSPATTPMLTREEKEKRLDDGGLVQGGGEISADPWREPLGWLRRDCDRALQGGHFGGQVEKSLDWSRSKSWWSSGWPCNNCFFALPLRSPLL